METQKYQVPVTTTHTGMVPITKKVPRTVYVNVTSQVPQTYKKTMMQTREKKVPVPYFVRVPETKYRTVTEQVPIQKTKVQMDRVTKTVYDTQIRTRCVPETKIVSKEIPVFNVIAKPASSCPPIAEYRTGSGHGVAEVDFNRSMSGADGGLNYAEAAFEGADSKMDDQLSCGEYQSARAFGNMGESAGYGRMSSGYGLMNSNLVQNGLHSDHGAGMGNALANGRIDYGPSQNRGIGMGNGNQYEQMGNGNQYERMEYAPVISGNGVSKPGNY